MQQRNSADVLRAGKLVAFVAAGLIFVAALLDALLFFGVTAGDPPNPFFFDFDYGKRFSITQSLAEEHLRETWAWNLRGFSFSALFGCAARLGPLLRRLCGVGAHQSLSRLGRSGGQNHVSVFLLWRRRACGWLFAEHGIDHWLATGSFLLGRIPATFIAMPTFSSRCNSPI